MWLVLIREGYMPESVSQFGFEPTQTLRTSHALTVLLQSSIRLASVSIPALQMFATDME
jgi:hypothetical protein